MGYINQDNKEKESNIVIYASVVIWLVGLSYRSGFGAVHDVYGKLMYLTFFFFIYYFLSTDKFQFIHKNVFIIFSFYLIHNVYTHFIFNRTYESYLWLYLIIAVYMVWDLTEKQMQIIGIIYGSLGGVVLFYANYTGVLSGWDGNSISIVCFISYTVFAASVANLIEAYKMVAFVTYSILYSYHLYTLGSRSSILFSFVLVLCVLHVIPLKTMLKNRGTFYILLFFPLILALFIVSIKDSAFVISVNNWSIEKFGKTIFNGRDELWEIGFNYIKEYIFFGTGNFGVRWHNSAVTALVGTGLAGYTVWIYIIRKIWLKGVKYIDDEVVFGLLAAYIINWMQQSVELGLIGQIGNPMYFAILGLIFARINTIKRLEESE